MNTSKDIVVLSISTFTPGSSVEPLISALPTAASHMETLKLLGEGGEVVALIKIDKKKYLNEYPVIIFFNLIRA